MSILSLRVYAADGTTFLGFLPDIQSFSCNHAVNDTGSFSLDYSYNGTNASLLTADAFYQLAVHIDGVERYRFLIEEDDWEEVGSAARSDTFRVAGRGLAALLDQGTVYPPAGAGTTPAVQAWNGASAGQIMKFLIDAAKLRGCFPNLTYTFTNTLDTAGVTWTDLATLNITAGTSMLSVLDTIVQQGLVDYRMSGSELQMYKRETAMYTDKSSTVIFRAGRDIASLSRKRSKRDLGNVWLVVGDNGVNVATSDATSISTYGRIERSASQGGVTDTGFLNSIASTYLALRKNTRTGKNVSILDNAGGPKPFVDFVVGDRVGVDAADGTAPAVLRVMTLACACGKDGVVTWEMDLGDRFIALEEKLARQLSLLGGGTDVVSYPTQPTAPNTTIPNAPTIATPTSLVYILDNGSSAAAVTVTVTPPATNTDGSTCNDIAWYQIRWRYNDADLGASFNPGPWTTRSALAGSVQTFDGVKTGTTIEIQALVADTAMNSSAWSGTTTYTTTIDSTPPPVPSTPTAVAYLGSLKIVWDGALHTDTTVTNRVVSGGTATLTLGNHLFTANDTVTVSGFTGSDATAGLNGTFKLTGVVANTSISYALGGNVSSGAPIGSPVVTGFKPSDFSHVEVHVSTSNDFTPNSSTQVGIMERAGTFNVSALTYGTTYYVKLVSVDIFGNKSSGSTQSSAAPQQATVGDIEPSVLADVSSDPVFVQYFGYGDDVSGWVKVSGAGTLDWYNDTNSPTVPGVLRSTNSTICEWQGSSPFPFDPEAVYNFRGRFKVNPTERLTNGDFASGQGTWSTFWSDTVNLSWSFAGGTAKATSTAAGKKAVLSQGANGVCVAGDIVRVTGKVRTSGDGSSAPFVDVVTNTASVGNAEYLTTGYVVAGTMTIDSTAAWTTFTLEATIPAGDDRFTVYFRDDSLDNTDWVEWDDLSIVLLSSEIQIGMIGYKADRTTPVESDNTGTTKNTIHAALVTDSQTAKNDWYEFDVYISDRAATTSTGDGKSATTALTMAEQTRYWRPAFIYTATSSGETFDIDWFQIDRIKSNIAIPGAVLASAVDTDLLLADNATVSGTFALSGNDAAEDYLLTSLDSTGAAIWKKKPPAAVISSDGTEPSGLRAGDLWVNQTKLGSEPMFTAAYGPSTQRDLYLGTTYTKIADFGDLQINIPCDGVLEAEFYCWVGWASAPTVGAYSLGYLRMTVNTAGYTSYAITEPDYWYEVAWSSILRTQAVRVRRVVRFDSVPATGVDITLDVLGYGNTSQAYAAYPRHWVKFNPYSSGDIRISMTP